MLLHRLRSLFRTLFRKDDLNAELDAELASYLDMLVAEKMERGLGEAEARREARLELGGASQVKTQVAERRIGAGFETLGQDIRFACRQFARNPGFALVAAITLALGIGANTAVFSVVNEILLRPLPYGDEDGLVTVWNLTSEGELGVSENEILAYRELPQLEVVGGYVFGSWTLSGDGEAEQLPAAFVETDAMQALGVAPVTGRIFGVDEETPGGPFVVLLSEAAWENRFGRDPGVLGRDLMLGGTPRTVIGILPAGFRLPGGFTGPAPEIVAPLRLDRGAPDSRNIHYMNAVGRLVDGATLGQTRTALDAAATRLIDELGTLPDDFSATAVPVREDIVGDVRPALLILLGAVGLVLLVACVNIANLLLARSDTRLREMAVRVSLGAARSRLIRQLATETGVLALIGGIAGLVVGIAGARALVALAPPGLPRLDAVTVDPRMFAFCLAATVATGLVIGMFPALRLSREEPVAALKGSGIRGGSRAGGRTRRGLVTAQVALAAVLAIGAGLLMRSLAELRSVNPGFDETGVMTFRVSLPVGDYPDHQTTRGYFERLQASVAALPGVERVGGTTNLPLAHAVGDWGIRIRGRGPEGLGERGIAADWIVVTPGYFDAMEIPIAEGRAFDRTDMTDGFQTVVISREFAGRNWPDGDAMGAQIRMSTNIDTLWRTVVGIAADVHQRSLAEPPTPAIYLPHAQFPSTTDEWVRRSVTLAVRTSLDDAAAVTAGVRAAASDLDPNVPVAELQTLEEVTASATATETFQGVIFGGFAFLALVLVVVGVYGVTAYLVARRTREIGIRIALGASPGGVRSLVLREGILVTGAGLAIGLVGAWMLSRLLSGLLYGVTARDPVTFIAVPVLLGITALLSAAIPAARAARVDPQEALRYD